MHEPLEDKIQTLARWISESQRIVFFGGAGVSEESGIKTFRGENGLFNEKWVSNSPLSTEVRQLDTHFYKTGKPRNGAVFFVFMRGK